MRRFLPLILLCACASAPLTLRDRLEEQGADLEALFAAPTEAELEAVRTDWSSRDLSPIDVEEVHRTRFADGRLLRILSHTVDDSTHYGAVLTPADDAPMPDSGFPLAVSLIGFGPPFEAPIAPPVEQPEDAIQTVTLFPSFRGHTLILDDQRWSSGGELFDQCDGGSDDVLAFIDAALSVTPRADPQRIVAVGGSRGGNVALIAAARDARIRRAVSMAGPDTYLLPSYIDHPNIQTLFEQGFLASYLRGEGTLEDARHQLLTCSPLYFVRDLPPVQLHHGVLDQAVPAGVLERMRAAWERAGRAPEELETYAYPADGHRFETSIERVRNRITPFLFPVLTGE